MTHVAGPELQAWQSGSEGRARTCVPFWTGYNALTVRPHTDLSTSELKLATSEFVAPRAGLEPAYRSGRVATH